ncbi:DUF1289 domain-containing protein [Enterovirga sp.]|uniref:DUF1289 domain-containing protein n=1 Tax=Enterovirga sp. TaxID=2026350 RepID=UPI002CE1C6E1|nr:DUF1289 domain-containing protein [Enterovirga sp.]HMO30549.1 DUF1289 domain-containing protein [Enterovirga sp.]
MTVSTPCIRVCRLDEEARLCTGCGRTRDEIAAWGSMSEEARQAVMAGLGDRLAAHARARPPEGRAAEGRD